VRTAYFFLVSWHAAEKYAIAYIILYRISYFSSIIYLKSIWGFLKMEDPQVTMAFNTKISLKWSIDGMIWGYPHFYHFRTPPYFQISYLYRQVHTVDVVHRTVTVRRGSGEAHRQIRPNGLSVVELICIDLLIWWFFNISWKTHLGGILL
jgi:hypothetical protein